MRGILFVFCVLVFSLVLSAAGSFVDFSEPDFIQNQNTIPRFVDDVLIASDICKASDAPLTSPGPGFYDTSEYMIGSIAVGVLLLESDGTGETSTETWTQTEENQVTNEITQAMNWWLAQNSNAALSVQYDWHYAVPVSYEPILHDSAFTTPSWEESWVNDAMASLGYSSGDRFARTRSYINDLRTTKGTDWAFAVYVIDSSADADGCFSDGYCAYAYLGGPFVVMTYDNNGWGISRMNQVMAHEMGHIFYATDEYNGQTENSGYLNAADVEGSGCLMDTNTLSLSSGTKLQIGWRDTDLDTIPDIIDTFPETSLTAYTPDPTSDTTPTYTGNAEVQPYTNNNPYGPGNDVTINFIPMAFFRVDGGPWTPTTPSDGLFDEPDEDFTFTTAPLSHGVHTIEAHCINQLSNMDTSFASDTITIDSPPNTPTITGETDGKVDEEYDYTVTTTDPDGDQVYYWIEWFEGCPSVNWDGPYPSGQSVVYPFTYTERGTFTIRVKAKDIYDMESDWATLKVEMPINKQANHYLLPLMSQKQTITLSLQ